MHISNALKWRYIGDGGPLGTRIDISFTEPLATYVMLCNGCKLEEVCGWRQWDTPSYLLCCCRHLATDDRVKGRDGLLEQLEEAASKLAGVWQHLGADS